MPPGKKAGPYHYRGANEEGACILEESGTLRVDGEEEPLSKGDYATLASSIRKANKPVNTSDTILRYRRFSTMV